MPGEAYSTSARWAGHLAALLRGALVTGLQNSTWQISRASSDAASLADASLSRETPFAAIARPVPLSVPHHRDKIMTD